ncbi:glycosyltransferase [Phycisphaerales bacterium AB-hyl4]|uniref:Glycosyltransferase n=1 Tax=Natronomicrosphaera hydrolytica TaxID=3242702 RepID=A0ABV4U3X1_9BACT
MNGQVASRMNIAFAHEWLVGYAGSERVLAAMASEFPQAPIFTLVHDPAKLADTPLAGRDITTSFIQRLPGATRKHQRYLPLMPLAIEQLDLRGHEVVVSSSHAVAKGVLTRADQLHISYMHTPIRYAWDLYHDYLEHSGLTRGVRGALARLFLHYIRTWDAASANRVDVYWANSHYVARRIWKTYRREAAVLYPPVAVDRFRADGQRDDFYLTASRLVPYKRVDLIVEAFTQSGRPLVVIGDGSERGRLIQSAGANVTFIGEQPHASLVDHMQRCRAFVYAADEDFGITPVEAQAAGAPVIAWGHGGVCETVVHGETGVLYPHQTSASLNEAVSAFEEGRFVLEAEVIRQQAQRFDAETFRRRYRALLDASLATFRQAGPAEATRATAAAE